MQKNAPLIESYDISEAELPLCQRMTPQQVALKQTQATELLNRMISIYFTGNPQEDTQAIRSYIHDQARYTLIVDMLRESNDAWQLRD